VAVDDSVFRRSGRKVHGAGWQHDGSPPAKNKLSYGNCFIVVAILVRLPFCSREVGLPVLARLHLPGKDAGPARWRPPPRWSASSHWRSPAGQSTWWPMPPTTARRCAPCRPT
jgi:hypothetical protein